MSTTCPRCRTPLASVAYEGVAGDGCRQCGGEWMGADELRDIIDIRELRASERRLRAAQLFLDQPQQGTSPRIVVLPPEVKEDDIKRY